MDDALAVQVLAAQDGLPQVVAHLGLTQRLPPLVQLQQRLRVERHVGRRSARSRPRPHSPPLAAPLPSPGGGTAPAPRRRSRCPRRSPGNRRRGGAPGCGGWRSPWTSSPSGAAWPAAIWAPLCPRTPRDSRPRLARSTARSRPCPGSGPARNCAASAGPPAPSVPPCLPPPPPRRQLGPAPPPPPAGLCQPPRSSCCRRTGERYRSRG